jgi:hypothetical protein
MVQQQVSPNKKNKIRNSVLESMSKRKNEERAVMIA